MINLYLDNGYLDMQSIIESRFPFIFLPAARGTGKTYGSLKYFYEHDEKILLIRRTQKEADIQSKADSTSYKDIFNDLGIEHYRCASGAGTVGSVTDLSQEAPRTVALTGALSTFATIRGVGFSDVNHIVFDEFIAEPHVRPIKNEGMALANLYESVNRNRELNGHDPVQLLCLSNSVNMNNDIFIYFGLIEHAEEMMQSGEEIRVIGNKLLILPQKSPISDKKAKTALYQAVDQEYAEMAIKNKFVLNDFTYIKPRRLAEYKCLFNIGDLYFYGHKSANEYYVTFKASPTKNRYGSGYADLKRAQRDKWRFVAHYFDGKICFENYHAIALFEKYFAI